MTMFRLAQRRYGAARWEVMRGAPTDTELRALGCVNGGPARDMSGLSGAEREELIAMLARRSRDAAIRAEQERLIARMLERCPYSLYCPPIDLDVRSDAGPEVRQLAISYARSLQDELLARGHGAPAWSTTNPRGGLHGDLAFPADVRHGDLLLAAGDIVRELAEACAIPLLSQCRAKADRPPVVLDDMMYEHHARSRGVMWRLPGARKPGGAPKTAWDLARDAPATSASPAGELAVAPLRAALARRRAANEAARERTAAVLRVVPERLERPDATEHDRAMSRRTRAFLEDGAPSGLQRREALAVTRQLLSAGFSRDETRDLVWRGLERSPWDAARPWTPRDVERMVDDLASRPSTRPPPPPRDRGASQASAAQRGMRGWTAHERAFLRACSDAAHAAADPRLGRALWTCQACGSVTERLDCSEVSPCDDTSVVALVIERDMYCAHCCAARLEPILETVRELWPKRLAVLVVHPRRLAGETSRDAVRRALGRKLRGVPARHQYRWIMGRDSAVTFALAADLPYLEYAARKAVECGDRASARVISRGEAAGLLRHHWASIVLGLMDAVLRRDRSAVLGDPWLRHRGCRTHANDPRWGTSFPWPSKAAIRKACGEAADERRHGMPRSRCTGHGSYRHATYLYTWTQQVIASSCAGPMHASDVFRRLRRSQLEGSELEGAKPIATQTFLYPDLPATG